MEKIVNVLGTAYTILESSRDTDPALELHDGYCDDTVKKIVIDVLNGGGTGKKENLEEYKRAVIRHELIHAFASESGLSGCSFAGNEEMVDWVAIQFPKMLKAFQEAGAL